MTDNRESMRSRESICGWRVEALSRTLGHRTTGSSIEASALIGGVVSAFDNRIGKISTEMHTGYLREGSRYAEMCAQYCQLSVNISFNGDRECATVTVNDYY